MSDTNDDITPLIQAKSDQLNADDLVSGPISVRIEAVEVRAGEQPVTVHISGGHKPWRPCKTTMRVLAALWSPKPSEWVGKSVRLFRDPSVTWAGAEVGGIRISGMSDISGPKVISLAKSKKAKAEQRIDLLKPVSAGPRVALMTTVKAFGATQLDLVEFMSEKTGSDPGPVDAWPDKMVGTVLARLQGGGADTFRAWLAERVNRSAVAEWQDGGEPNPETDDLPE